MPLGQLLRDAAARLPAKTALVSGPESLTYQELDSATDGLARWFLSQGLQPGDRVAIHWSNSVEVVKLLFACWKASLVAVPVNTRLKVPEIAYILDHSAASMCFSQPSLASLVAFPRVYSALPDAPPSHASLPTPALDDPAAILYTSGTTARPKGVTHTHRSLLRTMDLMAACGVDDRQTVMIATQMMHASGLTCLLVPGVGRANTLVLIPVFDAAAVLDQIERYRCTYVLLLPVMAQAICEEQAARSRDTSSLQTVLVGGDAVPAALQQRFQSLFGGPLREGYGMTEAVPMCVNLGEIRPGSFGIPLPGVQVRLTGLDGKEVADGEIGEFTALSPGACTGYWNDPEATASTLIDGWLYTGDLARRDPDGYYWFEGRKKQIIIRGGSNIAPQEVEAALYQHPAVLECGVIGVPDPKCGESVAAFVSLRKGHKAGEQELRDFARARIADYKVPERIYFLAELPKGITGKVQRRELRDLIPAADAAAT